MKALALKELREIRGIVAIAVASYAAFLISLMGGKVFGFVPGMPQGTREVPFVGSSFMTFFTGVTVIVAMVLGFRQSVWESSQETFLFLLHRPISRRAVIFAKLTVGMCIILGCAGLTILLYGWWAAIPGHHPGPFEWSMTGAACQMTILAPLVYLGSFLSGLRPARWFGTRILPFAAAALGVVFLSMMPWWWPVGFGLACVFYLLLVGNILFIAEARDYP